MPGKPAARGTPPQRGQGRCPASQRLSVDGIIAVGVVLMLFARFALPWPFFQITHESVSREP